jgi:hypothetical protein
MPARRGIKAGAAAAACAAAAAPVAAGAPVAFVGVEVGSRVEGTVMGAVGDTMVLGRPPVEAGIVYLVEVEFEVL